MSSDLAGPRPKLREASIGPILNGEAFCKRTYETIGFLAPAVVSAGAGYRFLATHILVSCALHGNLALETARKMCNPLTS
jgi:hypothetical protein